MSFSRNGWHLCLSLCLGAFATCADFERGAAPTPDAKAPALSAQDAGGDTPGSSDQRVTSVSFSALHQTLVKACGGCHAPGGTAAGTGFLVTGDLNKDRQSTAAFINREQPVASRCLSKAAGQNHGGGTIFPSGSVEYELVLQWIRQGASP